MTSIHVVAAILLRPSPQGSRVLLTSWPSGLFGCPGGKVQVPEPHHVALRRELREELGICVRHMPWLPWRTVHLPAWRVSFYRPTGIVGEPAPREGQQLLWATADEMRALPLTPANAALSDAICVLMGAA